MKKSAPAAFHRPVQPLQAVPSPSVEAPVGPVPEATASETAKPAFIRDKQAETSLDSTVNAELAAIMDAKVTRDKSRRRRGLLVTSLVAAGAVGSASIWIVSNPARFDALKLTLAEIKSAGDINGMVAKYQKAVDKVGERGKQIDSATAAMGIDPTTVDEHEDPGFDKEMQQMMGEEGGKTTAARDKILREKFGEAQKTGSLLKKKEDMPAEGAE